MPLFFPMTTYTFITLDGDHLATLHTNDPFAEIGELAAHHGVDADEIEWEETAVLLTNPCACRGGNMLQSPVRLRHRRQNEQFIQIRNPVR